MDKSVKVERTGWRDEALSTRHRIWGWNCPAADVDFLMLEYNLGLPCAWVEYKHRNAQMPSLNHPSIQAFNTMANALTPPIPFMIVFYDSQEWWFRVVPVNAAAKQIYTHNQVMSEREYVTSLYTIRNRAITQHVLQNLKVTKPISTPNQWKGGKP